MSRSRSQPHGLHTFGPAKINRPTLILLVALRCYAIIAVIIAIYSFFNAVR